MIKSSASGPLGSPASCEPHTNALSSRGLGSLCPAKAWGGGSETWAEGGSGKQRGGESWHWPREAEVLS